MILVNRKDPSIKSAMIGTFLIANLIFTVDDEAGVQQSYEEGVERLNWIDCDTFVYDF